MCRSTYMTATDALYQDWLEKHKMKESIKLTGTLEIIKTNLLEKDFITLHSGAEVKQKQLNYIRIKHTLKFKRRVKDLYF